MKEKYTEAINELYRLYNFFLDYFDPEQAVKDAKVFFTIQSRHGKKVLGHFAPEAWQDGENVYHEINIAAERLNRSPQDICETLLHECVHLHNQILGQPDCNASQHHNKHFKNRCKDWGLKASIMPGRGFALTELTEEGIEAVAAANVNAEAFKINRVEHLKEKKENPYITIQLKKELWLDYLTEASEKKEKKIKDLVQEILADYFKIDVPIQN